MIFSTVNALVETVGRTRTSTFADLDTLTAMWTGPTSLADTVPAIGSSHPEYPNMELHAQHKVADVAGISRIQLDYVGLFSGASIGIVGKGFTSQTGELDWQSTFEIPTGYQYDSPGLGHYLAMKWGLQTTITTYVSQSATFRYCAKGASVPRFRGGSILSTTNRAGGQQNVLYGFTGPGIFPPPTAQLFPGVIFGYHEEIFCSSFTAEPVSKSWFRCTEVWSARLVTGPG